MGFNLELHFLYPEKIADDRHRVWIARGQPIDFGSVTRLEEITAPRFSHLTWGAHQRASICVVSILLGKTFGALDSTPAETIAPSILAYEYSDERLAHLATIPGDAIDVGDAPQAPEFDPAPRRLGRRKILEHNATIALPADALRQHMHERSPVLHPPLLWEKCETLAYWLREAETDENDEWRELRKDPVSLALGRVWHAALYELGRVGARALFNFPF